MADTKQSRLCQRPRSKLVRPTANVRWRDGSRIRLLTCWGSWACLPSGSPSRRHGWARSCIWPSQCCLEEGREAPSVWMYPVFAAWLNYSLGAICCFYFSFCSFVFKMDQMFWIAWLVVMGVIASRWNSVQFLSNDEGTHSWSWRFAAFSINIQRRKWKMSSWTRSEIRRMCDWNGSTINRLQL